MNRWSPRLFACSFLHPSARANRLLQAALLGWKLRVAVHFHSDDLAGRSRATHAVKLWISPFGVFSCELLAGAVWGWAGHVVTGSGRRSLPTCRAVCMHVVV